MKHIFNTLLLSITAVACTSGDGKRTTGEPRNPRSAAVRVEAIFPKGTGSGSGTHMGEGNILTNKHVCDMLQYAPVARIVDHNGTIYTVQGIYNSNDVVIDLCLLRTNAASLPSIPFGTMDQVAPGKIVSVVGYPSGMYATMQGRVIGSTIIMVWDEDFIIPEFLTILAAPSAPGSSGSGILSDGRLVGVLNAGDGRVSLFVPLQVTKEFYDTAVRSFKD